MPNRFGAVALVAAVTLWVTGCKLEVRQELYVSDLRELAEEGSTGTVATMLMGIQVPSEDRCSEYSARLTNMFAGMLSELSARGCRRVGFETYLVLEAEVPVVPTSDAWQQSGSLLGVRVAPHKTGHRAVLAMLNLDKYEILRRRMSREPGAGSFQIKDSKITTIVINDTRGPQTLGPTGVFVDDAPWPYVKRLTLKRRKKAEIVLSNVLAAHLEKSGSALVFMLMQDGDAPAR